MEMLNVKVKRFIPEKGGFDLESYQVPYEKDMSVLMVLEHLYEEKGVHFRHSCDVGLCAICMVRVNGKNRLSCKEIIQRTDEVLVVEPVETFQPVRDLVVTLEKEAKR
jgi:succinate dehydrogenase / fumarate reductase iron-sulfur subunit